MSLKMCTMSQQGVYKPGGGSPLRDRVPKRLGSLQSRSAAYINAPSTKPICERTETQQNRSVDPVSLQFPSALQSGQLFN